MKDKEKGWKKLNPQRNKLLKEIAKGKSVPEAAKVAGYSYPQAANTAMRQMRSELVAALEKRGWGPDQFVEKYLVPMLGAKKTLYAQCEGIFTDSRDVEDNGSRISAGEQYLKVVGGFAPLNIEHSGAVVHFLTPAEKRDAEESVKQLLAYDSDAEDSIDGEAE
jgi:phage terminase small subunit